MKTLKNINFCNNFIVSVVATESDFVMAYYSYGVLVAVNQFRTNQFYSKTTSKHLNKHHKGEAIGTKTPEELQALLSDLLDNLK